MKNLLMVVYLYPPGGGSSGVLRPLKFSRFLPSYGWAPHVVTGRESLYATIDPTLLEEIPPEAVVHRSLALDASRHLALWGRYPGFLAVPDVYSLWLPFGVVAGLRAARRTPMQAIFSTSPPATAHLVAAGIQRVTHLPWVADFRDPWIEEAAPSPPATFRHRVESALERRVVHQATRLTVTTPYLRGDFLRRYPDVGPDRIEVLYNGYDEDDFRSVAAAPSAERFEIIHAGLVTREFRDPRPLLRVLAELIREGRVNPHVVRVTLLGVSGWALSPEFARDVRALGLQDIVACEPFVPHRDALARLSRAAALLLLQASDDTRALIPAKAFEYLRFGLPIIALLFEGATSDVLKGHGQCHVVHPDDQAGLRAALLTVYSTWRRAPHELAVTRAPAQYDRRALTGALATLLDGLTAP